MYIYKFRKGKKGQESHVKSKEEGEVKRKTEIKKRKEKGKGQRKGGDGDWKERHGNFFYNK